MDLSGYRTAIRDLLGAEIDDDVWTDTVIGAGLSSALREYDAASAPVEASLIVSVAGREQSMDALPDLGRVLSIAWPWDGTAPRFGPVVRWRGIGPATVWIGDGEPAVGDTIRVRYLRRHSVEGLGGAAVTTAPACDEMLLTLGAAGWCALIRARQDVEGASLPQGAARELSRWGEARVAEYRSALACLVVGVVG